MSREMKNDNTNTKENKMNAERMQINDELVHNWSQRYSNVRTGLLGGLPQDVRAAIMRAHLAHHQDGDDAATLARQLAAKFPMHLIA